jgi:hypothetical protein
MSDDKMREETIAQMAVDEGPRPPAPPPEVAPLTPTGEAAAAAEKKAAEKKAAAQPAPAEKEKEKDQRPRYVKSPARFSAKCGECGEAIPVGSPVVWDSVDKESYCAECGMELMEGQRKESDE